MYQYPLIIKMSQYFIEQILRFNRKIIFLIKIFKSNRKLLYPEPVFPRTGFDD
jgi:hypothetical protein